MLSSEHKAEAERLIAVARTKEGAQSLGQPGDPTDPVAATVLAGVHAALAAVPDDIVDAEVVDDEAEELVSGARLLAGELRIGTSSMSSTDAADLLHRVANALEERAGNGSGVQITADSFDADADLVDVERSSVEALRDDLEAQARNFSSAWIEQALGRVRGWLS